MSPDTERRELIRPDATIAYWLSGPRKLHGGLAPRRHGGSPLLGCTGGTIGDSVPCRSPDLRGHGESALADAFRFEDVVADVLALLDEVDTDAPLALVGLSLGGNIAQEIVYRAPDRVDALVVADATCNAAPRHPLAAPLTVATLSTMALTGRKRFMQRAAAVTSLREDVRRYLVGANADRSPREVVQILTSLVEDALHPDPDYRLPVPTLLLHGAKDRVGDIVAGTRAWAERDPGVDYAEIPDAGHASNQDNPDAFTAELTTFLDRVLLVPEDEAPQRQGLASRIGRRLRGRRAS